MNNFHLDSVPQEYPTLAAIRKGVLEEYLMTLETSQRQVANQHVQHDHILKKEILYMG